VKRKTLLSGVSVLLGLAFLFSLQVFSAEPTESAETKQLVALVDKAAASVESKGKDFFPELRKRDSEWWKGDLYVFVDGMDGIVLVNPVDPGLEGKNLLKDPASKAVVELLIEKAKTKGSGWVEYMWPKPGESTPSKKISYVKRIKMPDGVPVIIGAGMYAR